jgi:hypothetical protein
MITKENVLVFDIDGTLCEIRRKDQTYLEVEPKHDMVEKLKQYKEKGFYIILYTSRQMNTYSGNVGQIVKNTGKILFEWLEKHDIPYDEIHFGKPWCGVNGFYIDDKAVRPKEFLENSYEEILKLIEKE